MADISSEKVTGLLGLADALRLGEPGAQSLGSFELLRFFEPRSSGFSFSALR